jgi:hypothetical protein
MAHLALEGAQISRPIVSGQEKKEGREIFFVEFDVFAGGDGVHGAAVFAFGGNRAFAFGSVLAGDFGATLPLFAGQFFAWHGEISWRCNGKGVPLSGWERGTPLLRNVARGSSASRARAAGENEEVF